MKKCSRCKIDKEEDEFSKDKSAKDGLKYYCKSCRKEEGIKYKKNNKESIKESLKKYRENHKEQQKQYKKKYDKNNTEKVKKTSKNWYKNNFEKVKLAGKKWRKNNPDKLKQQREKLQEKNPGKIKKYQKKYYENNKEKIKEYYQNNKEKLNKCIRERRLTNPLIRLKGNYRNAVRYAIKKQGYTKKTRTHEILGCSWESFKTHIESLWEPWMNWDNYGNPKNGLYELNKTWDIDHIIALAKGKTEKQLIKLFHWKNCQPLCSYVNRFIKRDN